MADGEVLGALGEREGVLGPVGGVGPYLVERDKAVDIGVGTVATSALDAATLTFLEGWFLIFLRPSFVVLAILVVKSTCR